MHVCLGQIRSTNALHQNIALLGPQHPMVHDPRSPWLSLSEKKEATTDPIPSQTAHLSILRDHPLLEFAGQAECHGGTALHAWRGWYTGRRRKTVKRGKPLQPPARPEERSPAISWSPCYKSGTPPEPGVQTVPCAKASQCFSGTCEFPAELGCQGETFSFFAGRELDLQGPMVRSAVVPLPLMLKQSRWRLEADAWVLHPCAGLQKKRQDRDGASSNTSSQNSVNEAKLLPGVSQVPLCPTANSADINLM